MLKKYETPYHAKGDTTMTDTEIRIRRDAYVSLGKTHLAAAQKILTECADNWNNNTNAEWLGYLHLAEEALAKATALDELLH
jgi:hypothetical protein